MNSVARRVVNQIGYDDDELGFNGNTLNFFLIFFSKQSPDIAQGVDEGKGIDKEQGAGDQGLMPSYACKETDVLMPLPIHLSHLLVKKQADLRNLGTSWLRPDVKSQVSVEYDENFKAKRIDSVVISTQHSPDISQEEIREFVISNIIKTTLPEELIDSKTNFFVNPNRSIRYWRTCRRLWVNRQKNNCRHLWRHGKTRGWSLFQAKILLK